MQSKYNIKASTQKYKYTYIHMYICICNAIDTLVSQSLLQTSVHIIEPNYAIKYQLNMICKLVTFKPNQKQK